jgi:hypothetical protein
MSGGIPSLSDTKLVFAEELCKGTYTATQFIHSVTVVAEGSHPTTGYQVSLSVEPTLIFPPQFKLTHIRPIGEVAQQITHFTRHYDFHSALALKEVLVTDVEGTHAVEVKQVKEELATTPTCS